MNLAELIKLKRTQKGFSQRKLAELAGVSSGAVGQWETGQTSPTNENMSALKLLLDIETNVPVAPGTPYVGQLVDDPDELAWLGFWRRMTDEKRRAVVSLLQIGRPPPG